MHVKSSAVEGTSSTYLPESLAFPAGFFLFGAGILHSRDCEPVAQKVSETPLHTYREGHTVRARDT